MKGGEVLSFFAGLGIGGTAGYLITRKVLESKQQNSSGETEALKATVSKLQKENSRLVTEMYFSDPIDTGEEKSAEKLGYLQREEPVKPEDFESGLEKIDPPEEDEYSEKNYRRIEEDIFIADTRYGKCDMTYYKGNDIMFDNHDNAVNDPEGLIGDWVGILNGFGRNDILCIRNERTNTDYRISIVEESFVPDTGG